MNHILLLLAIILLVSVTSSKLLYRYGVPTLLIFLVMGMLFGSDGPGGVYFDDYETARRICSVGLIFIIFYGGFGTSWKHARPVAAQAVWMASLGVVITAALTGLFCSWLLNCDLWQGMLIGAVISSTDAASVFAILRSRKLNLKGGLASLLEVESGSNDPTAYMLTLIVLRLMGQGGDTHLGLMIALQVGVGLGLGALLGLGTSALLRRVELEIEGLYSILIAAVALLAYALSESVGGNGYLCVYVAGIILGNSHIPRKKSLVPFFDGLSWLMQIALFFTLGLLAFPSRLPEVAVPGTLLFLFVLLVARPVATFAILSWFRTPVKQQVLVSWVGLRGAASIVFAIYAVLGGISTQYNLFNLVFCVVLLSMAIQGTLLPWVAGRLSMTDQSADVGKTFTDYQEESDIDFVEVRLDAGHPWCGQELSALRLPAQLLVAMVDRGGTAIVPRGDTRVQEGDRLVLAARAFEGRGNLSLREVAVDRGHKWANQSVSQIATGKPRLIILIKRGLETMIPTGSTVLQPGDMLVVAEAEEAR